MAGTGRGPGGDSGEKPDFSRVSICCPWHKWTRNLTGKKIVARFFFFPTPAIPQPSAGLTVQISLEGSLLVLLLDVCMQNTHAHTHTHTLTLTYVHTPALTHTFPPINEFVLLSLMQTYTYIFFKWYISELSVLSHPYNDVSKCLLGSGHVWALFPGFSRDDALSPIVNPGRL